MAYQKNLFLFPHEFQLNEFGSSMTKEVMFLLGDTAMLSINWNLRPSSDDIAFHKTEPLGK